MMLIVYANYKVLDVIVMCVQNTSILVTIITVGKNQMRHERQNQGKTN